VWNIFRGGWSEAAKDEEWICEKNKSINKQTGEQSVSLSSNPLVVVVVVSFYMFVCHVFYLSYLVVVILISCSAYSLSDELKFFFYRPARPT